MIGTRKLVGLAQVRRRAGILIQAGIHLRFDPLLLASVLGLSVDAEAVAADLSRAAIGLDEASGTDIAAAEVMAAVNAALEEITGMALVTGALTDAEECHTRTFAI
jgi:lipoate-protein ligase A